MNEVSERVISHVIITYGKTPHHITKKENKELQRLPNTDSIYVEGCTIRIANIAEILTISKYYEQNPKERPGVNTQYLEDFQVPAREYVPIEKRAEKTEARLFGLIDGLGKYIDENPQAKIALDMYIRKMRTFLKLYGRNDKYEVLAKRL